MKLKILIPAFLLLFAASCVKYVYIPSTSTRVDSMYQARHHTDTVYERDSAVVKYISDTVFIEKWHTKYRIKELLDTIISVTTDTIREPYPVEVELTKWQKIKLDVGGMAIGGVAILIIGIVIWIIIKIRI